MEKLAQYFESSQDGVVTCRLCPALCVLPNGKTGICGCRFNKDGQLFTDNYGEAVSIAVDPIEKKPLYHFHPSKNILSTGANGCNFKCVNCQNWTISQEKVQTSYLSPEQLVSTAKKYNSIGVAFTYTEPMIWFEYIMDTAPLLKNAGLKVVLVSNGYINQKPLMELIEYVDAFNIDLKGINPEFYKKICKGLLEPVLENIKYIYNSQTHIELTNLIIPGKNDSDEDITSLVNFISSISDMIPLHFSAYHPDYKLDIEATPMKTMLKAKKIAQEKLKFVYLGNILSDDGSQTVCPQCGSLLVNRDGYRTSIEGLDGSKCKCCNFMTNIIV